MSSGIETALDTTWVLICAFLVFFMNTGFGCVEAGFCRAKNAVNILAKNFVVFGIASLAFWALGFGLMFSDGTPLFGSTGWFLIGQDNSPLTAEAYKGVFSSLSWAGVPLFAKFFFQLAFAATAATIVSGCVAERIHYSVFMIFAFLLAGIIYPVAGHWIWGGGWLAEYGVWDFAGSTVVHSVGGWAGLSGVYFLGPRIGKYSKQGKVRPILGHNMPLAFMGGMILWLGWFGFNPGSTMGVASDGGLLASHIVVTTNIACASALIMATICAFLRTGKPDFSMTVNGALAGLVAITAPCAFVTPFAAFAIGLVAGVLVVYAVILFDSLKLDDPVGALSVHLVCGVWGTMAVGLWATTSAPGGIDVHGLFYGGGVELLIKQIVGIASVGLFTLTTTSIIWFVLSKTIGLRVSPNVEVDGLDVHEMGSEAYPFEQAIDVLTLIRNSSLGSQQDTLIREVKKSKRSNLPPDAPIHYLKIENVDIDSFQNYWNELSSSSSGRGTPEGFNDIYKHYTTMNAGQLRFRGGDSKEIRSVLGEIVKQFDPEARVVSPLDEEVLVAN